MQRQLWKNNKMLREPQNDGYTTSIEACFFGKEFHNLKTIPQNRDVYVFLNFLAAALSLKKIAGVTDMAGESRGQILALMSAREVYT